MCCSPVQILLFNPEQVETAQTMHAVCSFLFPQYSIIGAMVMMQYQHVQEQFGTEQPDSYFKNRDVQISLLALVCQLIIYPVCLVAIDRCRYRTRNFAANNTVHHSSTSTDVHCAPDCTTGASKLDEDVEAEYTAAENGGSAQFAIRAVALRKTFDVTAQEHAADPKKGPMVRFDSLKRILGIFVCERGIDF
eukprot:COSAG05_NODE_1393_length_4998_cov_3.604613_4_plen_192_part_00